MAALNPGLLTLKAWFRLTVNNTAATIIDWNILNVTLQGRDYRTAVMRPQMTYLSRRPEKRCNFPAVTQSAWPTLFPFIIRSRGEKGRPRETIKTHFVQGWIQDFLIF